MKSAPSCDMHANVLMFMFLHISLAESETIAKMCQAS